MLGGIHSLFYFLKDVVYNQCYSFCFGRIQQQSQLEPADFVCGRGGRGRFLSRNSISLVDIRLSSYIFHPKQNCIMCIFKEFSVIKLFIIIPYFPFNTCRIYIVSPLSFLIWIIYIIHDQSSKRFINFS